MIKIIMTRRGNKSRAQYGILRDEGLSATFVGLIAHNGHKWQVWDDERRGRTGSFRTLNDAKAWAVANYGVQS